ncbi:hypothetical protein PHISCL_11076 [Aspergillus sclerotialis]|uniref:Secreted protein n=1 Tax=Aspergillus sclerotialis TaxID=2070753 RepID=A0A3A2Z5E8_9EURO|nr:hypothetical protein PHISCL_11076 [Aspergillus sclerotialis]
MALLVSFILVTIPKVASAWPSSNVGQEHRQGAQDLVIAPLLVHGHKRALGVLQQKVPISRVKAVVHGGHGEDLAIVARGASAIYSSATTETCSRCTPP